jgi:MFS transporter, DHA3 family, multidrug efflux protein
VTLLVPAPQRDRANGMVGTVTGVSFAITSVFSGLVVGRLGMGWALGLALVVTLAALLHLVTITIDEPARVPAPAGTDAAAHDDGPRWIDVRGALDAIRDTPGLMALILFAAFNNLLGGVFMALMDAYGLSLVSVEAWGFLFGALSFGFIVGGLIVARRGLGRNPLRMIIVGNLVNWTICTVFTLRSSIIPLALGMFLWLTLIPVIEAAEQTVLQRAVPYERQGRVFGFAQTVENAASPLTAFLIGPIAEVVFIPFMTTGRGVDLIGGWFGTGPERGLALIFTLAGIVGLLATARAWTSKSYRILATTTAQPAPLSAR